MAAHSETLIRVIDRGAGAIEYEIEVVPAGVGPKRRDALRAVAAGRVRLPPALLPRLRALVSIQITSRPL